jgi:3,4-dihydroxy-2-butanone 4-phosphate synthase
MSDGLTERPLSLVEDVASELTRGRMVVVIDPRVRENEGDRLWPRRR